MCRIDARLIRTGSTSRKVKDNLHGAEHLLISNLPCRIVPFPPLVWPLLPHLCGSVAIQILRLWEQRTSSSHTGKYHPRATDDESRNNCWFVGGRGHNARDSCAVDGQIPAHTDSHVEWAHQLVRCTWRIWPWLECVDMRIMLALALYELLKWFHGSMRGLQVLLSHACEKAWDRFWCWRAPALNYRSAFKLTNTFWHSSLACMLLQKCLLELGRRGPWSSIHSTVHRGRRATCISWVDLSLQVPVSDGSLYKSDALFARHWRV